MPIREPEFWNRRTSAATILTNLNWTIAHIWTYGRMLALGILAIHLLLGIQPALLIYVTQHLIDTVVAAADNDAMGFDQILPWLVAFGLTLLLTNEVLWKIRDMLHMRLQQKLEYALGRRFLAKAARTAPGLLRGQRLLRSLGARPKSRPKTRPLLFYDHARLLSCYHRPLGGGHVRPGLNVDPVGPVSRTGAADPPRNRTEPDVYGLYLRRDRGRTPGQSMSTDS